jgi:adenylate cyclase
MKIPLSNVLRLRTALLICFIGLTLFSGLSIILVGFTISQRGRIDFAEIGGHFLTQSISAKVENILQDVEDIVEMTERFSFKIENGKVDYRLLLNNLASSLMINHNLGTVIYTEEKTGYTLKIAVREKFEIKYDVRLPSRFNENSIYVEKDIIVEEITPNSSGTFTLKTYSYPDFPHKPLSVDENGGYDYRIRPWYILGKKQKFLEKGEWTNCYSFVKNTKDVRVGLTYASALGDGKDELFGVLGMDIGTEWVSGYLSESMQEIHKKGIYAFIFEKIPDGSSMILAHSLMADVFPKNQDGNTVYYSSPKEMKDPAIEKMILSFNEMPLNGLAKIYDFEKLIYFDVDGSGYVGFIKTVLPGTSPDWYVCFYVPTNVLFKNANSYFYLAFGILIIVIIISVIFSFLIASLASKPLESLVLLAQKMGKLDFTHKVPNDSKIIEIKNLAHSMNLMQIGLRAFIQYLPKDMLQSLFDAGASASPGGKEKDVSIMFADIANFTHYSEKLSPNDLVLQLNEFFGCFSSVIIKNEGTVDKYIGDAVMAYWNAPRNCDDYAFKACSAVIQCLHNLSFLQKEWARLNKPIFKVRVGINTGNVVIGNVGTNEHLSYTVMGDNVNLASRLEGLNKVYDTTIMISDVTLKACGDRLVTRPIDLVGVKGKDTKILVHELLGLTNETSSKTVNFCSDFKTAFNAYVKKDWSVGLSLFQKLASENPDDRLSQIYMDRCREYQQNPPDGSWDGGYQFHEK